MSLRYKTSLETTEEYINFVADQLLSQYKLTLNTVSYSFTEIEIYFYSDMHKDKYCHEKEFHKNKYKNGDFRFHYSGIDIVLTDNINYICGILIRGIKKTTYKDNKFLNGPLICMNEILNNLHNPFHLSINTIQIVRTETANISEITNIVRYGLSDKFLKFKNKKYRYLYIKEIKKHNTKYYNRHIKNIK